MCVLLAFILYALITYLIIHHQHYVYLDGINGIVMLMINRSVIMEWDIVMGYTLWLFNIAMGNDPFMDGLPIKNCDFPWLC